MLQEVGVKRDVYELELGGGKLGESKHGRELTQSVPQGDRSPTPTCLPASGTLPTPEVVLSRVPLIAGFLVLAGCAPTDKTGGRPSWLEPCHVDGYDVETLCGTLPVPIEADGDATLDLRVVVVPAVKPVPETDPLVLLAGGPGQAATEAYGPMMNAMSRIQQSRDLILMDQRGTGSSRPLDCPDLGSDTLRDRFSADVPIEEVTTCRDALLAEVGDLTPFTTRHHTHDLEALRHALSVDTWNLYGGSYGTRAALDYAEVYPDRVRSLILDGVAPRTMPLFGTFAVDGQAALDALVRDCLAETGGCAEAFSDLPQRLDTLLARSAAPVTVLHPRTGAPEPVPLPGRALAASMRNILYAPQLAALLPVTISRATGPEPDLQPLITLASAVGGDALESAMSLGMMLSVACTEDVYRLDGSHVASSRDTFLGTQLIDAAREWCGVWPVPSQDTPAEPVTWDGPVLLLSGALDPVTPPRWAEEAAQTLPRSHHLVAPGGGHIVFPSGCLPVQAASFLETGEVADPDCVQRIQRPPFAVDFAGPPG